MNNTNPENKCLYTITNPKKINILKPLPLVHKLKPLPDCCDITEI